MVTSSMPVDFVRWQIQTDLEGPPESYRWRGVTSRSEPREYITGRIRGFHFVLRRYEDREPPIVRWVRPRVIGEIDADGDGSIVRYRAKFRRLGWLVGPGWFVIGAVALGVGLSGHTTGSAGTVGFGLGALFIGLAVTTGLSLAAAESGMALEAWLRERCARTGSPDEIGSFEPGWAPDPLRPGGWRWWTGYAWGGYSNEPPPPSLLTSDPQNQ